MKYLKCFMHGLTPDLEKRARKELGETSEIRTKTLKEIKKLIDEELNFNPCVDDAFLLRFLRAKKFNVDKAFKTLTNAYKLKARYSGVICDITPSDLKPVLEQGFQSTLEYRDQHNTAIGIICFDKYDDSIYTLEQFVATFFLLGEVGIDAEATQVAGYSLIYDCKNFGFNKFKFFSSPRLIYDIATQAQECLPARVKGIHIINESFYVDAVLNLCRLFLPKKLHKRLHCHGTDMKSLHKYITPDILPEEMGGKQGPMSNYTKKFLNMIYSKENHFVEMQKYGYKGKTLEKLSKRKN